MVFRIWNSENKIRWHKHEKLAHYASDAYDIEFNFQSLGGFKEVEGIHARGDWDLSQHSKYSGVDLSYFNEETKKNLFRTLWKHLSGLNRLFLMFIDNAYIEEEINGEIRTVLKIDKRLAPIKAAVFPLLKNKPELVKKREKFLIRLGGILCASLMITVISVKDIEDRTKSERRIV